MQDLSFFLKQVQARMGSCCGNPSASTVSNIEEADAESKKGVQRKKQASKKAAKGAATNRITVYVIQAKNLPGYDIGKGSDPYCVVTFSVAATARYRTTTAYHDVNPVWNASFVQEGQDLFSRNRTVTIDVYDRDSASKDDFMGTAVIETNQQPNIHYATPIQYVPLVDKQGKPVMDDQGRQAALQIKLKYTLNTEDMNVREYTHIIEATVKQAKHLGGKLLKANPYVTLEFGAQTYETKRLQDSSELVWDEICYIFAHSEMHANFQLKVSVLSDELDNTSDHVGTGYIAAADIFKQCTAGAYTAEIALREVPVSLDKGLVDFDASSDDEKTQYREFGVLQIEFRLREKSVVDKGFYSALVRTFDSNDDGTIDRNEVMQMFAELKIPRDADQFFERFDENKDGQWDESEVVRMLQDTDFQSSELAPQLMSIYLRGGDLGRDRERHLMSGFTNESAPTSQIIKVMDRHTGLLVQEHIPGYVQFAFKLLYGQDVGRTAVASKLTKKILEQMSVKRGRALDEPSSKSEIGDFIKQHNLDTKILYKKPDQFATFNDFFARPINVDEYRPLASPEDETVVVSAADCRFMCWDSILDSAKFWVKGKKFTVENLCGANSNIQFQKYMGGSFCIFRLAPQDYHRWHWPVGGTVKRVVHIEGALYSVNPVVVNSELDVYTENKRAVIEIENAAFGGCLMFAIAATMVGSYKLFRTQGDDPSSKDAVELQEGDQVKRGDVSGEFRFGGSTILCLFEPNKVNFDDDITHNVNAKFETLVRARSRIGILQ